MDTSKTEEKTGARRFAASGKTPTDMFEGTLVSIIGDKLLMTNKKGRTYAHVLAVDATCQCNGTKCAVTEMKAGSRVRVTSRRDDRSVATGVECVTD